MPRLKRPTEFATALTLLRRSGSTNSERFIAIQALNRIVFPERFDKKAARLGSEANPIEPDHEAAPTQGDTE